MTESTIQSRPAPGLSGLPARLSGWLDLLIETVAALLLCVATVVTLVQVVFRYGLNHSLPWPEEMARWAFVWLVFLGSAMLVRRGRHIAIDLFAGMLEGRAAALHAFAVRALMACAAMLMVVIGLRLVGRSSYVSPALGWPFLYLYLAAPTGGLLSLFFMAVEPLPGWRSAFAGLAATAAGVALFLLFSHVVDPAWLRQADIGLLLLLVTLGLILIGVPVAYSLIVGCFIAFLPSGPLMIVTVPQSMTSALDSFLLLAIPFFTLAAALMNVGGITGRLIAFASSLVGHLRGGLGHVNVLTNAMMGGVSGSSLGDAAALAKTLIPEMEKRGYPKPFSCALTSSGAILANMIPPSMGLIIYGALASASVGALFVATIVPGILMALTLALVVHLISVRRGFGRDVERATGGERLDSFVKALPALVLPVVIVGGIRFGIFTATEAGAVATLYALLCGIIIYRTARPAGLLRALREGLNDTVAVTVIIAAAAPFAWLMVAEQVPQEIARAMGSLAGNWILLILIVNLFLIGVGLIMEMIAAMVILVPILVPLVKAAGIDPVHFGIILVANLCLGALTPPLGILVFTTAAVTRTPVVAVFRAALPFIVGLIGAILLISLVPALSLGLARVLGS